MKEEHCKMYLDIIISEYTLKLIKLCHFLTKISQRNICPLYIQYTERLNLLPRLQFNNNNNIFLFQTFVYIPNKNIIIRYTYIQ